MTALIIILVWILVGNIFGIFSYKWDMGECPKRWTVWVWALIGPVSIAFFLCTCVDKLAKSSWWNRPIC
jgi:uncharacterized membrane protein YpjA